MPEPVYRFETSRSSPPGTPWRASAVVSPTTAATLLAMHPTQYAYAVAVAALETAYATASAQELANAAALATLAERDEVEAELEAMRIERAAGIPDAFEAIDVAAKALIAWGLGRARDFAPEAAADLLALQARSGAFIVLQRRVAEMCMRLPAE